MNDMLDNKIVNEIKNKYKSFRMIINKQSEIELLEVLKTKYFVNGWYKPKEQKDCDVLIDKTIGLIYVQCIVNDKII